MKIVFSLAGRNIRVFLRDRVSVFFSLLSMIIIIALYALFLGDMNVQNIRHAAGDVPGIRFLVDSWIMAGILVVNSVTVVLGVYGTMIDDEQKKRMNAFLVAPVKRSSLTAGYIAAAWAVGFFLNLLSFAFAQAYILLGGGQLLPLLSILKAVGLSTLNVLAASGMMFFFVSFVHTANAFATLSTIIGTTIGFLTGIYVPIGVLPEAVQSAIMFVPASYGTALMRQVFMEEPMKMVFAGAPAGAAERYMKQFGVKLYAFGQEISAATMLLIVAGAGLLFYALSVLVMRRKRLK